MAFDDSVMAAGCVVPYNLQSSLEGHKWLALPSHYDRTRAQDADPSRASQPPQKLLDHAPLVVLLNSILAALNDLRHYAAVGLRAVAKAELEATLAGGCAAMARYRATHQLSDVELGVFTSASDMMGSLLAPYLDRCFRSIYPGKGEGLDLNRAL